MKDFIVGVSDKVLMPWLEGREYLNCSNEAEAVSMAAGYFLTTGKRGTVFMSADGFCNASNYITSWIMPEEIEMNIVISTGRKEPPHKVMTDILPAILDILGYDPEKIKIEIIKCN